MLKQAVRNSAGIAAIAAKERSSAKKLKVLSCRIVQNQALSSQPPSKVDEAWKLKMLYDGECPLCLREVKMLRERNKKYQSIKFVDISAKDYSADENSGINYETAMGRIHAISSDGQIFTNVQAFKELYESVGLGWVYAITKYEPFGTVANALYDVWAKYRLPLTGRPPLCSDSDKCTKD